MASVAALVRTSTAQNAQPLQGRLFCSMPLPDSVSATGLPVHINACMDLNRDSAERRERSLARGSRSPFFDLHTFGNVTFDGTWEQRHQQAAPAGDTKEPKDPADQGQATEPEGKHVLSHAKSSHHLHAQHSVIHRFNTAVLSACAGEAYVELLVHLRNRFRAQGGGVALYNHW